MRKGKDEEVKRLDESLEKLRYYNEKYKRIKQGLMQELLTKGIGHKEFKDTEIGKIPKDWKVAKLENICVRIKAGGTPPTSKKDFYNGDILLVKIKDITGAPKYLKCASTTITRAGLENSSTWLVPSKSILFAMYGSIGAVSINEIPLATNQAILAIIPNKEKTDLEFLYYLLAFLKQYFKRHAKQTTQANLTAEIVREFKIPLPPLPEQKRIVARIEELFSKIEEIKRLRKESLERAKALMPSALHEIFSKADEKGWRWVRLGKVLREDRKTINPREFPKTKFWHLTMDCIESNTGKLVRKAYLQGSEIKSSNYQFDSEHILYGKLNPYLNKVYSVPDMEQGICTTEFIPFISVDSDKNYVAHYLRTKNVVDFAMANLTGTTLPRTDIDALLEFQIPLPPLSEQRCIVSYLDKIQEKATALQKFQEDTKKEIEKLRESILYKAFRGEL